jgi:hypothetical protein
MQMVRWSQLCPLQDCGSVWRRRYIGSVFTEEVIHVERNAEDPGAAGSLPLNRPPKQARHPEDDQERS